MDALNVSIFCYLLLTNEDYHRIYQMTSEIQFPYRYYFQSKHLRYV